MIQHDKPANVPILLILHSQRQILRKRIQTDTLQVPATSVVTHWLPLCNEMSKNRPGVQRSRASSDLDVFFNEVSLLMGSILVDENGITWCRNGYPEYSPNCFRLSSSFTLKRCVGGHEDCHKDCTLGSIIRPRQHEDCR